MIQSLFSLPSSYVVNAGTFLQMHNKESHRMEHFDKQVATVIRSDRHDIE